MNKFNVGDKVMRRNDFTSAIYTVVDADVQTKDRVVIEETKYPFRTDRVAQNNLRKLSGPELSLVNAFNNIVSDMFIGDKKVSEWDDKFHQGDTVMCRHDHDLTVYKVDSKYATTRGRVIATEVGNCVNQIRVSQNSLRKVSSAELNVIRGYEKLLDEVVNYK